ncbi:hypothetical protein FKM82_005306 [Ascaphus truei]
MSQFEQAILASHNAYRARHRAPPLQLSRGLCNSAQKWADYLLSIHTMKHSGWGYGENIYWTNNPSIQQLAGNVAVDAWYNEIKFYNFSNPGFASNTGHFTQVIWRGSTQLGVGLATDGRGTFYVVGQYNPPGNVNTAAHFQSNVLP